MSSSRPRRPALTPDLALVPLTSREEHPDFPTLVMSERPFPVFETNPMRTTTSETSQIKRSVAPAFYPLEIENYRLLPSLALKKSAYFKKTLVALRADSGREYVPSVPLPPVSLPILSQSRPSPKEISSHTHIAPVARPNTIPAASRSERLSAAPVPVPVVEIVEDRPSAPVYPALIYLNLKNLQTDLCTTFAVDARLPFRPFASQIIDRLGTESDRFQRSTGKWHPARTHIAYSRKLIPISDPTHQDVSTGYKELGYLSAVVGNFTQNGFGGSSDDIVPEVLPGKDLDEFKELYSMAPVAKIFSLYLFYLDHHGHEAAVVAATSDSSAPPPLPRAPHIRSTPPALSSQSQTPHQYLEERLADSVALYRAVDASPLASGYKHSAVVRLIRHMALQIGFTWPDAGVPKTAITLEDGYSISIENILTLSANAPVIATFKNQVHDYNQMSLAQARLLQYAGQRALTDAERNAGALFFNLASAAILDPSAADFRVPSLYTAAVTASAASVKAKAAAVLKGEDPK
ncbi:hypothetical protein DFH09DRAFT_1483442 [Mycena vulgaris]|nr:hypothetical protein DFH09DRAFT_1483442 [Mycena vulgaris]